jgi:hypothetical protein
MTQQNPYRIITPLGDTEYLPSIVGLVRPGWGFGDEANVALETCRMLPTSGAFFIICMEDDLAKSFL